MDISNFLYGSAIGRKNCFIQRDFSAASRHWGLNRLYKGRKTVRLAILLQLLIDPCRQVADQEDV
ncbi:hypothetical protein ACFPLB_10135 [Aquamicrobium segne]|uniref:Transposase n=1 Tax=Aquamicrobium segne TaxID=469547 RepID=A0ABW0GY59_9HYPH